MNKLRQFCSLVLIIFVLSLTVSGQNGGLPRFKKGESYQNVRFKMLKAGWKPYHSPKADECADGDKRCENRPEMEACAGTGFAPCSFLWKRRGKTVSILTIGEDEAGYNGYKFR